jgi:hypothetical protein
MSRPLTFFMKIKLFRLYLKKQQNGVIIDCAYCGSTNLAFSNQKKNKVVNKTIYTSRYECNNCGAICKNHQDWIKN